MRLSTTSPIAAAIRRIAGVIMRTPLCAVLVYILTEIALTCGLVGCQIEPPLRLPANLPETEVGFGDVVIDINLVWDIDADWRSRWWYGWDEDDEAIYGKIEYPEPDNYETRFYFFGEDPSAESWLRREAQTVYGKSFRRRFDFGYHNMLVWSNVISTDGTQALVIDENDPDNVHATTSRSRLTYALQPRDNNVRNNPEIFYAGLEEKIHISNDTLDYDFFDPERNAWVKNIKTDLTPLVYIYLVQVAVYNNNGRIVGMNDDAGMSQMADGVHVHTGHTSNNPVIVTYPMRLKKDLYARDGKKADIFGGKLTTFGLCDIDSWARSRAPMYSGSRTDLRNHLMLGLSFANGNDSSYNFDVTSQLQKQVHGGVVTIEIDADTLDMPFSRQGAGAFNPTIEEPDSIEHEFIM